MYIDDCYFAVKVTLWGLEKLRTDKTLIFKAVKEEAKDKCDPPVLHRQQQPNMHFNPCKIFTGGSIFEAINKVKGDL